MSKHHVRASRRDVGRGFNAGEPLSFLTPLSAPQINGIALDNKSVTECEALLRSCRDTLSLSLMKVFLILIPHSCKIS